MKKIKIILTSTGFILEEVVIKIKKIINKPFENIKMLVIPQARKYKYNAEKYIQDYIKLGFKQENIYMFNDAKAEQYKNLNIDMLYVCGGNTFLLKECLEKSGFYEEIRQYVNNRSNIFRR